MQAGGGAHGDAGGDPALEAGHPDHEELVEVAGEDRQEPHPLEQRQVGVLGELEHPLVEAQPGQLAVEEAVVGLEVGAPSASYGGSTSNVSATVDGTSSRRGHRRTSTPC